MNFSNNNDNKMPQGNTAVGMTSIAHIYKIGRGPSSSHTMGPEKACVLFKEKNPDDFSVSRHKCCTFAGN